jgi:ppGpp synthetase/RelA/SpoT-type nucleotidyltranferase
MVINMPVYDDPDYTWKQMMKEKGVCDPYDEILKEFKDKLKEIEDKMQKINNE